MGGCMRERDRPTSDVTLEVHEEVKPGCTPTIGVSGDTVTVTAAAGDKFIWVETYPYPDQKDNFRWHQQYKHRGHLVASVKLSPGEKPELTFDKPEGCVRPTAATRRVCAR